MHDEFEKLNYELPKELEIIPEDSAVLNMVCFNGLAFRKIVFRCPAIVRPLPSSNEGSSYLPNAPSNVFFPNRGRLG